MTYRYRPSSVKIAWLLSCVAVVSLLFGLILTALAFYGNWVAGNGIVEETYAANSPWADYIQLAAAGFKVLFGAALYFYFCAYWLFKFGKRQFQVASLKKSIIKSEPAR